MGGRLVPLDSAWRTTGPVVRDTALPSHRFALRLVGGENVQGLLQFLIGHAGSGTVVMQYFGRKVQDVGMVLSQEGETYAWASGC